jgi:NAD(P)-dependent dehydrogenase (short-subunit alcohol dehydrogenase family)
MDANEMTALDLSGKTVVITGASRGIGAETARRMAAAGARVIINYHSSDAAAEAVVSEIGERAVAMRADVADPDAVKRLIDGVVDRFGAIDVLVNNAAVFEYNPFDGDDYDAWQRGWKRTFDLNVFAAANAAWLAMRAMRRGGGGGKIINVASRAAWRGETEFADYGASKAALVNLTRSIARACAKDNIVASCVAPGFIETEMARPELVKHYDDIVSQIPLRRVGSVGDVAGVILFLASPMGDYLNGVTIDINGGSWFQ